MCPAQWLTGLQTNWHTLDLGDITATFDTELRVGDKLRVGAEVYLNGIPPEHVAVQLYEGVLDRQGNIDMGHVHHMECVDASSRGDGWHQYAIEFECRSAGRHGYTIRIVPHHPDLRRTLHLGLITWA